MIVGGPDFIANCVRWACVLEVTARKPGNVHRFRDFDDATYLDFLIGADVVAQTFHPGHSQLLGAIGVGPLVREAVLQTQKNVGHNINLGIILLLAPLVAGSSSSNLRTGLTEVLSNLTINDAKFTYQAIQQAQPGGLGQAPEQDVSQVPTVTLLEAMQLAADRDAIARQYVTNYADVFDFALPTLRDALQAGRPLETAIVFTHLQLMAERPDTLIARKCGPDIADESARRASDVLSAGWPDAPGSVEKLRAFDGWLLADGHARNPGATADLIAATLYVALFDGTIERPRHLHKPGWDAGDKI